MALISTLYSSLSIRLSCFFAPRTDRRRPFTAGVNSEILLLKDYRKVVFETLTLFQICTLAWGQPGLGTLFSDARIVLVFCVVFNCDENEKSMQKRISHSARMKGLTKRVICGIIALSYDKVCTKLDSIALPVFSRCERFKECFQHSRI